MQRFRSLTWSARPGWTGLRTTSVTKQQRNRHYPGLIFAAILFGVSTSIASAASIRVEGDKSSQNLKVHLENASVERVLGILSKKFGFEYIGPSNGKSSANVSMTLSGTLDTILGRLLRNRNHSIVRAASSPSRIRRVVLIDTRLGSKLTPGERPGYRRTRPVSPRANAKEQKIAPKQSRRAPHKP